MKKVFLPILLISLIITSICFSCAKNPINGDLDGQWQLMEISMKKAPSSPNYDSIISRKESQIFWSFQLDLMMIRTIGQILNGHTEMTMAKFNHHYNQLDITSTYIHYRERDSLIDDPTTTILEPMGISGNAEKFSIQTLNRKRMVLTTPTKRLTFRKY